LDKKPYGVLSDEMRRIIIRHAIIEPEAELEAEIVLRFVPTAYAIQCNKRYRLILELNPKYLMAKPRFHRYIHFQLGQIASNLEFNLENGIQILILFPNLYQTDGFMISQQLCGQKLSPSKNFRPVFWTEEHYKKYIEFRIRYGITTETKKLHDEMLLTYTVKDCRIFVRPPDCDSYYLLGPGLAHIEQKIIDIMPRLFQINAQKLDKIIPQHKGLKDPRTSS
jgi:hypothetical protein